MIRNKNNGELLELLMGSGSRRKNRRLLREDKGASGHHYTFVVFADNGSGDYESCFTEYDSVGATPEEALFNDPNLMDDLFGTETLDEYVEAVEGDDSLKQEILKDPFKYIEDNMNLDSGPNLVSGEGDDGWEYQCPYRDIDEYGPDDFASNHYNITYMVRSDKDAIEQEFDDKDEAIEYAEELDDGVVYEVKSWDYGTDEEKEIWAKDTLREDMEHTYRILVNDQRGYYGKGQDRLKEYTVQGRTVDDAIKSSRVLMKLFFYGDTDFDYYVQDYMRGFDDPQNSPEIKLLQSDVVGWINNAEQVEAGNPYIVAYAQDGKIVMNDIKRLEKYGGADYRGLKPDQITFWGLERIKDIFDTEVLDTFDTKTLDARAIWRKY